MKILDQVNYFGKDTHGVVWEFDGRSDVPGEITDRLDFERVEVQVSGNLAGACVTLEGSLDGHSFFTLVDRRGMPLSFYGTGGIRDLAHRPKVVRPAINNSSDNTKARVMLIGRRI